MKNLIKQIPLLLVAGVIFTSCQKAPSASFTVSSPTVNVGDVVTFTGTTSDGEKATFHWDFGDGTTSMEESPTHVYERAGTFLVRLIATKSNDRKPTEFSMTITVLGPVAKFSAADTAAVGQVVSFTDQSTEAQFHVWDFGDGTGSEAVSPTHVYAVSGIYTVELTVYSDNHESPHTVTETIVIIGGTGSPALVAKIVGHWAFDQYQYIESYDFGGILLCAGTVNTFIDFDYEFLSSGDIIITDPNGEQNQAGFNWSALDETRIEWMGDIYEVTELTTTSFVITRIEVNNTGGYFADCMGGNFTVANLQTITEIYTFSR